MAEVLTEIATVNRGGIFQLLEQGQVGEPFTGDLTVYRVTDDQHPNKRDVRVTIDGDALTLTFEGDNADALGAAIIEARTLPEQP